MDLVVENSTQSLLLRLPDDLLFELSKLLTIKDVFRLESSCARIRTLFRSNEQFLFRALYYAQWQSFPPTEYVDFDTPWTVLEDNYPRSILPAPRVDLEMVEGGEMDGTQSMDREPEEDKLGIHYAMDFYPFPDLPKNASKDTVDWKKMSANHFHNRLCFAEVPIRPPALLRVHYDLLSLEFSEKEQENPSHSDIRTVRAERPLSPTFNNNTVGYFEAELKQSEGNEITTIGVVSKGFSSRNRAIGWRTYTSNSQSVGLHGDDGRMFSPQTSSLFGHSGWSIPFNTGSVVGCGINFNTREIFFTLNGRYLGAAYKWKTEEPHALEALYPAIALRASPGFVCLNFGQRPFVYDLTSIPIASDASWAPSLLSVAATTNNDVTDDNDEPSLFAFV